jgi:predicted dehydrogenase
MKKIAFLGCAHIHTPGFINRIQARDDVSVTTVWDHDAERAAANADKLNAAVAASPDAVCETPDLDGIVICSETDRHETLVKLATEARKPVFVEKPLGMGGVDAFAMAHSLESSDVIFQTGYFMRSQPVHRFLREQVAAGTFGKITRIRMSNCHAGSLGGWFDTDWRWMADPAIAGCGAFGDLGTHVLDIMLWIMGNPTRVTADIGVATGRYDDCDEYGEGMLAFADGAVGTLAAGWVDVANPVSLIISGTEGHATVLNGTLYIKSDNLDGADGITPWNDLPDALPHAFDLFIDALHGDAVPLVTPREAAIRSAVMEAMYKASESHTWIEPKLP